MKNIITIITLLLFIVSCDPNECATLYINNSTNSDLEIKFYKQNDISKNIYIDKNAQKELFSKSCATGSPLLPDLNTYDSIIVCISGIPKIVYRENKPGKSIYNYDYWITEMDGKNNYEYIFEITEEDLSPEGD